jgi:hypothetical protein
MGGLSTGTNITCSKTKYVCGVDMIDAYSNDIHQAQEEKKWAGFQI